jgi:hypothetical protein
MHDKCNRYSRDCYYNCQKGTNSIDPPYCDLFSIIIISIGHGTQEQGINLSLVNPAETVYTRKVKNHLKRNLVTPWEGISTLKPKQEDFQTTMLT